MSKGASLILHVILIIAVSSLCFAQEKTYRIDVLQVRDIPSYQDAYQGFIDELGRNGLIEGENLTLKRTVINLRRRTAGFWQKMAALFQIRKEASRIADESPDLVLTIGTSATYYGKKELIKAGIPVVFTSVADPIAVGCQSVEKAGSGFTGATEYMDVKDMLQIIKQVFPMINRIGIIHSDSKNATAQVKRAREAGPSLGITFVTKKVSTSDHITPAVEELQKQGVQAFIVPLDTYYAIRNYEACRELIESTANSMIPVFSFVLIKYPGAVIYMGSEFGTIGMLSAQQAVKILKEGVKPETLPILRQLTPTIMVDQKALKTFNVLLPEEIQNVAKPLE